MEYKKIIVLGSKGQLGVKFCERLKKEDLKLFEYDKDDLDITNFEKLRLELFKVKPDLVINCTAYNDVDGAEGNKEEALLVNGLAVGKIAMICDEIGATLLHYSSDYVFSGEDTPYHERETRKPINVYGKSKLLGEESLEEINGFKYYLIRTSCLFGMNEKSSFPLKLLSWIKGGSVGVVNDKISAPTYVVDLVEATMRILDIKKLGVYHIAGSGKCTRYEWAKYFLEKIGNKAKLISYSSDRFVSSAIRPDVSLLDCSYYEKTTGIKMPDWKDATDRFIKDNKIKNLRDRHVN